MALNFPGPYVARIHYTTEGRSHIHQVNMNFNTPPQLLDDFTAISPVQRDGGVDLTLDDVMTNYLALIALFYRNTSSFGLVELFSVAPLSFDFTFISSKNYGVVGGSGLATKVASELILTFRTQEGGVMRMSWLETTLDVAASIDYAGLTGNALNYANFIIANDNVFLARDTSYPVALIGWHQGNNEALFKKIYRS